jgi:hypothetical protein
LMDDLRFLACPLGLGHLLALVFPIAFSWGILVQGSVVLSSIKGFVWGVLGVFTEITMGVWGLFVLWVVYFHPIFVVFRQLTAQFSCS